VERFLITPPRLCERRGVALQTPKRSDVGGHLSSKQIVLAADPMIASRVCHGAKRAGPAGTAIATASRGSSYTQDDPMPSAFFAALCSYRSSSY